MRRDDADVVYIRVPVVKKWKIYFDYDFWYVFHFTNEMSIEFHNLDALVSFKLRADEHGHLYPQIHDVKINIANSVLFHKNQFFQWMFRQFFDPGKYIIQNGVNYFGPGMFNKNIF